MEKVNPQAVNTDTKFSFASGTNTAYIEGLYQAYLKDPESIDITWQKFFAGYEFALTEMTKPKGKSVSDESTTSAKVQSMINGFRRYGHLYAHTNPLAPAPALGEELSMKKFALDQVKPAEKFVAANLPSSKELTLSEIYDLVKQTYCGKIGVEYYDIDDSEVVEWFQKKMETSRNQIALDSETKKRILTKIGHAEGFEKFLQARYLGQKRFSVEGLEVLIAMLDMVMNDAKQSGVEEINIGMAHRGRLNALVNIMGKSIELLLKEFEGSEFNAFDIDGDVKYHMGFASSVETYKNGPIRMYLSPNPSHLEMVNPVLEGFTHCRQRILGDKDRARILPILLHGDAAFIGQGIVAETLNFSRIANYTAGGTLHIITNNQVGFTTNPDEGRSTRYSSAIAKMIGAPILHVNADDPEACIWAVKMALEYRLAFGRDIVLDVVGYRRHGHNETDEPGFTQPLMYQNIAQHPTLYKIYGDRLTAEGALDQATVAQIEKSYRETLQAAFEKLRSGAKIEKNYVIPAELKRSVFYVSSTLEDMQKPVNTAFDKKQLVKLTETMTAVPQGFSPHPKIEKLFEGRRAMVQGEGAVDWGLGELLAFSTLAVEGHHVRLSGQDCRRGTFSHRHGVIVDYKTNQVHHSLNHFDKKQAEVNIMNSPLSELAVMGFEFGYAVADSTALVMWEGQFGDFANGAQIIIDQFISASEAKWKQTCGLVLLLPHGYEGQGPEHSSARPERFLQLCGNLNMQVAIPTTPAQYFHILRRQMKREFRKPLILMTPKSLLRHPSVVSPLKEFSEGAFQEVIGDLTIKNTKEVTSVVLCTGKVYYDLVEARKAEAAAHNVPIIRMEQLYPFAKDKLLSILAQYPNLKQIRWTQEEPQNMGAWTFVFPRLVNLPKTYEIQYVGRKYSGTTAEGSAKAHAAEQQRIVKTALGLQPSNGSCEH